MMQMIASRRADGFATGESNRIGRTISVASALHDSMRDSHSVMCGRIQTASQVHIRSWCIT
jgi:hypothetical protein